MLQCWRIRSLFVLLLLAAARLDSTRAFSAPTTLRRSMLRMDTEEPHHKYLVPNQIVANKRILTIPTSVCPMEQAQSRVGMPWTSSIDPTLDEEDLLYMPFWKWQFDYMKEHLSNLKPLPVTNLNGTIDFSYQSNEEKQTRIVNLCFQSDEYRKIRMTYYDAGKKTQVFNSLWYPRSNLPLLGIDLLQFNGKKHLAVVDFQPLHRDEDQHDATYSHLLQPIQSQYPSLQGKMSKRFYDESQFFSQHMLFSRFEEPDIVQNDVFPAFEQYVKTHVDLTKMNANKAEIPWSRHVAYDVYSAQRDPATHLFETMFGKAWADAFVEEFLFDLCCRQEPPPGT